MYIQYRIIGLLLACCVLLFNFAPIPTTVTMFALLLAFLFCKFYLPYKTVSSGRAARREAALKKAKVFLAPYEDMWRDLKLSNSYCYLTLGLDGFTIEGFEKSKSGAFRSFKVLKSNVHDWEEVWNMFCKTFSYNKSYDGLIEDCRRFKLVVEEKLFEMPVEKDYKESLVVSSSPVDINNCSESELAELPGVSVIMAKKLIKRRKEIGGFNNIEEFFAILKLNSHMQNQLKNLICVGKKSQRVEEKRSVERRVDF